MICLISDPIPGHVPRCHFSIGGHFKLDVVSTKNAAGPLEQARHIKIIAYTVQLEDLTDLYKILEF